MTAEPAATGSLARPSAASSHAVDPATVGEHRADQFRSGGVPAAERGVQPPGPVRASKAESREEAEPQKFVQAAEGFPERVQQAYPFQTRLAAARGELAAIPGDGLLEPVFETCNG